MAQFEKEAREEMGLLTRAVNTSSALVHFEGAASSVVPNGSRDRFGNCRANIGGRPRKTPILRVGIEGPKDASNRADPTRAPLRFEMSGFAQVKLITDIKARLAVAAGDQQQLAKVWKGVRRDYPDVSKRKIKQMLRREAVIKNRVAAERLGAGYGISGRSRGVRIVGSNEAKVSLAIRRSGAGRKYNLKEIMIEVKLWHDAERRMGHQVDASDVRLEFEDRVKWHIVAQQGKKEGADVKKIELW